MTEHRRERALVRPHVVTGGRAYPSRNTLDAVTLVTFAVEPVGAVLSPQKRRLMELCRGGALSVAEVAAHLTLPLSVTRVLISDLVDAGYLAIRAPLPPVDTPDLTLLKELLDGLRTRL